MCARSWIVFWEKKRRKVEEQCVHNFFVSHLVTVLAFQLQSVFPWRHVDFDGEKILGERRFPREIGCVRSTREYIVKQTQLFSKQRAIFPRGNFDFGGFVGETLHRRQDVLECDVRGQQKCYKKPRGGRGTRRRHHRILGVLVLTVTTFHPISPWCSMGEMSHLSCLSNQLPG